jgi:N-acetyl-gamma-glutamyl-phosphate reductase
MIFLSIQIRCVGGAGGGKNSSLFSEVSEGFRAYNVGVHRHEPRYKRRKRNFLIPDFVCSAPGTHEQRYLNNDLRKTEKPLSTKDVLSVYKETYRNEPLRGSREGLYPDTRFVRYSNYCDMGLKSFDDGRIVLISAIDNLVRCVRSGCANEYCTWSR